MTTRDYMIDSNISIHAPREGGDYVALMEIGSIIISIHAPREGGDGGRNFVRVLAGGFQSTPPARGATPSSSNARLRYMISIHAPREGGDCRLPS